MWDWLNSSQSQYWISFATTVVKIIGILVVAIFAVRMGRALIRKTTGKSKDLKHPFDNKRIDTISTILSSIYTYTIYIFAGIALLTNVIDTGKLATLMTAAGIGSVIIGFAAQNVLKDFVVGFFILFENQYSVGDNISIDSLKGVVEEFELRVTRIRTSTGDMVIIPNGEIKKVINHSRDLNAAIVDIPLSYGADIRSATEAAQRVCATVGEDFPVIMEGPQVLGVSEFQKDCLVMRIFAKTIPNEQWQVEREIRYRIKEEFDRCGIKFANMTPGSCTSEQAS